MASFGNYSTSDLYGPSMKVAMKAGLHPPIGASPGELRLWLKLNGMFEDGKAAQRRAKQPSVQRIGQVGRKAVGARLPPIQKREPLADKLVHNDNRHSGSRLPLAGKKHELAPPNIPQVPERPSGVSVPPRAFEPEDRKSRRDAKAAELTAAESAAAAARARALEDEAQELEEFLDNPVAAPSPAVKAMEASFVGSVADEAAVDIDDDEPPAPHQPPVASAPAAVPQDDEEPAALDESAAALEASMASIAVDDELAAAAPSSVPDAAAEEAAAPPSVADAAAEEAAEEYAADDYEAESIELEAEPIA